MRVPDNVWAMLVLAVDILGEVDPDTAGQVALFAGSWLADQPPADLHDGDLVIRPLPSEQNLGMPGDSHVADVEVLLAYRGRWMPIGSWAGLDERWPWTLAPTDGALTRHLRQALRKSLPTRARLHPLPDATHRSKATRAPHRDREESPGPYLRSSCQRLARRGPGLQVSLEAARTKLTSLDRLVRNNNNRTGPVNIGLPIISG